MHLTHRIVEFIKLSISPEDKPFISANWDQHFVNLWEHEGKVNARKIEFVFQREDGGEWEGEIREKLGRFLTKFMLISYKHPVRKITGHTFHFYRMQKQSF